MVLALVNMAALVSGLGTFMPKFIEKQFSQTISFSNMMIGESAVNANAVAPDGSELSRTQEVLVLVL